MQMPTLGEWARACQTPDSFAQSRGVAKHCAATAGSSGSGQLFACLIVLLLLQLCWGSVAFGGSAGWHLVGVLVGIWWECWLAFGVRHWCEWWFGLLRFWGRCWR